MPHACQHVALLTAWWKETLLKLLPLFIRKDRLRGLSESVRSFLTSESVVFHQTMYEPHASRGHATFVHFNFVSPVIAMNIVLCELPGLQRRSCHLI